MLVFRPVSVKILLCRCHLVCRDLAPSFIDVGEEGFDVFLPVPKVVELTLFGILAVRFGDDDIDAHLDHRLLQPVRLLPFGGFFLGDEYVVLRGGGGE